MPQEENNAKVPAPKKKKKTWIFVIFLLPLMLLGASYGYFYGIKGDDQAAAVDIKDIKQYPMDSFTANLADMGQTRYIRTSITLEYLDKKAAEELDIKKHRLNDIIITSLREKTVSDLDSPEKTQKLKNELLSKINSELTKGKLTGLYFNEFIIQ